MPARPSIRMATQADYDRLGEVMFHAVRDSNSPYTPEQRQAWVPEVRRGAEWAKRLTGQQIFLAEAEQKIIGFISLAESGYIDLAFVVPNYQGTGLFRELYDELEKRAKEQGEKRLWVHGSIMAQPAFAAMGFDTLAEELVEVKDQTLRRFKMQKLIS